MRRIVTGAVCSLFFLILAGACQADGFDVPPGSVLIKPGSVVSNTCNTCTNPISINNKTTYDIQVTVETNPYSLGKGNGSLYATIPKLSYAIWDLGSTAPLKSVTVSLPFGTTASQTCDGCTYTIWNVTSYYSAGKDFPVLTRSQ